MIRLRNSGRPLCRTLKLNVAELGLMEQGTSCGDLLPSPPSGNLTEAMMSLRNQKAENYSQFLLKKHYRIGMMFYRTICC